MTLGRIASAGASGSGAAFEHVLVGNLADCDLGLEADAVICDVLSTCLLQQPMAPILNNFLRQLRPTEIVIPMEICNFCSLVEADFAPAGNANIQKYAGTDREGYGCMSLQQQTDAWANLTNDGYNSSAVRQLASMSTFDGQPVDASLIAACIQLGAGNCQKMVDSGKCSGFSDVNGTTICGMAKNARSLADPNCQNSQGTCGPAGPGDYPTTTGVAANPPSAASASIIVSSSEV